MLSCSRPLRWSQRVFPPRRICNEHLVQRLTQLFRLHSGGLLIFFAAAIEAAASAAAVVAAAAAAAAVTDVTTSLLQLLVLLLPGCGSNCRLSPRLASAIIFLFFIFETQKLRRPLAAACRRHPHHQQQQ